MKKIFCYLLTLLMLFLPMGYAGERTLSKEEQRKFDAIWQKRIAESDKRKKEEERKRMIAGAKRRKEEQDKTNAKSAFVAGAAVGEASKRGWFKKAWLWIVGAVGAIWALLRGKKSGRKS